MTSGRNGKGRAAAARPLSTSVENRSQCSTLLPLQEDFDDPDATLDDDVRYVAWVVRDNERWNAHGIGEGDVAVCFEMSGPPALDGRYSVARLRRALKEAKRRRLIQITGSHYFPAVSVNATTLRETINNDGERKCGRVGCEIKLDAHRPNARYCSTRCQDRARRTRQAQNHGNNRRSEAPEVADFRVSGPTASPTDLDSQTSRSAGGARAATSTHTSQKEVA